MLQSISSVFIVYRRETLTGSPDPTHANGTDKTLHLTLIRQDISQYPHWNVMSCHQLLKQLEDYDMDEKAEWVRTVIDKGLNSYAPSRRLPPNALAIEPKYFIWVIQKKNMEIIDWQD